MSDEAIDVTPLLTANAPSARAFRNKLFGVQHGGDYGIKIPIPNGEIEMKWSIDQIEHFMKIYLSNDRPDNRWFNRRRWNYAIWRFIVGLYADGLTYAQIAEKLRKEFPVYSLPGVVCNNHTVKTIIDYRNWKVAKRMKELLSLEQVEGILARRKHAASRAEKLELKIVEDLEGELDNCTSILKQLSPIDKEYNNVVQSIDRLKKLISNISGLDSIRHLELFKEKQNVKQDFNSQEVRDPKTITPTIISE